MKTLILCRGVSGSGKTTFAKYMKDNFSDVFSIEGDVHSADNFFMQNGKYVFDASKLGEAHKQCLSDVQREMQQDYDNIVVANTFTTDWEIKPYYDMASRYGYRVFSIIIENRHNGVSVHSVPEETIIKQKERLMKSIKL